MENEANRSETRDLKKKSRSLKPRWQSARKKKGNFLQPQEGCNCKEKKRAEQRISLKKQKKRGRRNWKEKERVCEKEKRRESKLRKGELLAESTGGEGGITRRELGEDA